jgi:hypothetical protein
LQYSQLIGRWLQLLAQNPMHESVRGAYNSP